MLFRHRSSLREENKRLRTRSLESYVSILQKLCRSYSHYSFALVINLLLMKRDFAELVVYADFLSSQKYDDATTHFVANQFSLIIRKYPFDSLPGINPEETAKKKFLAAEHSCKRMNRWFEINRYCTHGRFSQEFHSMRSFIQYVIGVEVPLGRILDNVGFGPGASIGVHGNATNVFRKLSAERWSVTPGALYYAYASFKKHAQLREVLFPEHGGFSTGCSDRDFKTFLSRVRLVNHNKITFVPKTCLTHRSIAIEPLLNGLVQKGIDTVLRKNLLRVGIDLSDQTINQKMARSGSLSDGPDSFVTIDLSSASDSISIELCRELLPHDWFHFLDANRSKRYELDNVEKHYHKFVSMGNGFCFPLQSLLFTAACNAVGAGKPGIDFHVYGDDIIVKQRYAQPLILLLKGMGFRTNANKTFTEGPFRESCGADYFGGVDVRPFTLDFTLDSIQALFKFLNLTNRSCLTQTFFSDVRDDILSLIPRGYRFHRPYQGPVDSGIDPVDEAWLTSPSCHFSSKRRAWIWHELIASSVPDAFDAELYPSIHVYGALSGSASGEPFALRNVARTRVRKVSHPGATSQWLPYPLIVCE